MTVNKKTILILGGSGFIGERLGEVLSERGYLIRILSRNPDRVSGTLAFPCEVFKWDGSSIPDESIRGCFGVINLAGESVSIGRWTQSKKKRIEQSRVSITSALSRAVKNMGAPPEVVIQGSAIGYYGSSSGEKTEDSNPADDFLGSVCQNWENALVVDSNKTRIVVMRTGLVLGWSGGALPELALVYASGLGAVLGNGNQCMNWIHIDDIANFVSEALAHAEYTGPYNLVAPENIANKYFHQQLAQYYILTSPVAVPSFVLKAVLGQKSSLLLDGPQVVPENLREIGFKFTHSTIESAFSDLFNKWPVNNVMVLQAKQYIPVSLEEIWSFVSSEVNLEKLTPPWLNFKVLGKSTPQMQMDTIISYKLKLHGVSFKWKSKILEWNHQHSFVDTQVKGPYKVWHHKHSFIKMGDGVQMIDFVQYSLPFFPFSVPMNLYVKKDVEKIFKYRQEAVRDIFW